MLLVGHSYGGAVISVAGASTPNAVGLVYVAAFALDEGESFGEIFAKFGDTPLVGAVRPSNYPLRERGDRGRAHDRARALPAGVRGRPVRGRRRVLAVSQRPFAAIFDDRAAGRGVEDAAVVVHRGDRDNAIPPDAERHMASVPARETIEVDASHSIALSQPGCGGRADSHRGR